MNQKTLPVLYSFRRCPYAIRARLAIDVSKITIEVREISLRNKPEEMLSLSSNGTVPTLVLPNGSVIDESLDVMFWALNENDPSNLLSKEHLNRAKKLIEENDRYFKPQLDKYKYAVRFPESTEFEYRQNCEFFLEKLEQLLSVSPFLLGARLTIADLAIFPFIRQFASVNRKWFESSCYGYLINWLESRLQSESFKRVMCKQALWEERIL